MAVTFLARPADDATLDRFFTLVRPSGPGWEPVARRTGVRGSPGALPQALLGWVFGCAFVYAALFGTGSLIYGKMPQFLMWLVVFVISGAGLLKVLRGYWVAE